MLRPLCLNLSLIQQQAIRFPAQGKAELFQQSAAGSIFRHGFRLQEGNALPAGKRQKSLPISVPMPYPQRSLRSTQPISQLSPSNG